MAVHSDGFTSLLATSEFLPVPPSQLGKYRLVVRLSRGGMADIYLSLVTGVAAFRKLVVVKQLRENLRSDPMYVDMFLDEARLAVRFRHPNIVHTHEVDVLDGHPFMAMEYLEGVTLGRLMRALRKSGRPIDPFLAVHVASEVLTGLHYAHELTDFDGTPLDIVHRDVSPPNVILTYEGETKLIDFGIAKSATQREDTDRGLLKGKLAYVAPEHARGHRVDRRADLFTVGIVLWEMLAARRLFHGLDNYTTLKNSLEQPIPRLASIRADLPRGLDALVQKALERDPQARFATAAEMRDELDRTAKLRPLAWRRADVAQFVQELFADLRDEQQNVVRAAAGTATFSILAPARLPNLPFGSPVPTPASAPPSAPPPSHASQHPASAPPPSLAPSQAPPGPSPHDEIATRSAFRAPRQRLVIGLIVAAASLALVVAVLGSEGARSETRTSSAGEPREPRRATRTPSATVARTQSFDQVRVQARELYAAARYDEAAELFERMSQMDPRYAGAHAGLGASLLGEINSSKTRAIEAYRTAVEPSPGSSGYHAALARALRVAGRRHEALREYRRALRLDRRNRAARLGLRQLLRASRRERLARR